MFSLGRYVSKLLVAIDLVALALLPLSYCPLLITRDMKGGVRRAVIAPQPPNPIPLHGSISAPGLFFFDISDRLIHGSRDYMEILRGKGAYSSIGITSVNFLQ